MADQNRIDQLTAFRQRDKFSNEAWNNRGLYPPASEISATFSDLFNNCADKLIDAVRNDDSDKQLEALLQSQLSTFRPEDYDTEEREFICELFFELSQLLNIEFGDKLMQWLYGEELADLIKEKAVMNPPTALDIIRQTCLACGTALDAFIMQKEEGIPDFSWNIIQCNNCKDYTLVSYGPNVKMVQHDNYITVEQLPKEEFTFEQAKARLEQVKLLGSNNTNRRR